MHDAKIAGANTQSQRCAVLQRIGERTVQILSMPLNGHDLATGGEVTLAMEELNECVAGMQNVEMDYERKEIVKAYVKFLDTLPITERRVFLCRYWYVESIETIADKFGFSQSKVKTMLHRTRAKLRRQLAEEGYE